MGVERERKKGKPKVKSTKNKNHVIDGGNLCYFPAFFNLMIFSEDLQAFPGMLLQVALDSSGLSNNLKVLISSPTETLLLLTHTVMTQTGVSLSNYLKEMQLLKMKMTFLSLITHPRVVPNP